MDFVTITAAAQQAFAPLLPEGIVRQLQNQADMLAIGAVEGQTPVGVLVAALEPQQLRLVWLCTAEQARGRGVARALVRRLVARAYRDPDTDRVLADVRRGVPFDPMYPLLLSEGWLPVPFSLPDYSCTLAQLAMQPFWQRTLRLDGVQPLGTIAPELVQAYSDWLDTQPEQAAVALPLQVERYDPALSMGYVSDGRLQAVLLASKADGTLVLEYAQAQSTAASGFAKLVYAAGQRAMADYPPETRISFAAITPASERLADKLLPPAREQPMYRMSFWVRNIG